jgi:hypothetical protein
MRTKVLVYELVKNNINKKVLVGTIGDVRTFIKNRWKEYDTYITRITGINVEEDFYTYVDDTHNLFETLDKMGYNVTKLCEVSIEDFMD